MLATLVCNSCKRRTNTIIMITNPKKIRIRGSVMMMVIRVQTPRDFE
jgi:hypothetical protein